MRQSFAAVLLALGCRAAEPSPPAPAAELVEEAEPAAAAAPERAEPAAPVEARAEPAPVEARACKNNERLDSGCVCRSGGACFDICCGEDARCAHPARPGGPSACLLSPAPPAPEREPKRACKDGEELASGCRCADPCMDICCVGSACSHHASEDGGWAKCVSLPKRR